MRHGRHPAKGCSTILALLVAVAAAAGFAAGAAAAVPDEFAPQGLAFPRSLLA